jgi:hypothetical protein
MKPATLATNFATNMAIDLALQPVVHVAVDFKSTMLIKTQ